MFYRMTRIHYEEGSRSELIEWARAASDRVRSIPGLRFADLVETGTGEGMVLAGYDAESDYRAAAGTVEELIGEMRAFLSGEPHGHAGSVIASFTS